MTIFILILLSYIFFPLISIEVCYSILLLFPKLQPEGFSINKKFKFLNIASSFILLFILFSLELGSPQTLNKAITVNTTLTIGMFTTLLIKEITKLIIYTSKQIPESIKVTYFLVNILILPLFGLVYSYLLSILSSPLLPILIILLVITLSLQIGSIMLRFINRSTSQGLNLLIHESILFSCLFILLIPTTLLIEYTALTTNILLDLVAIALIAISIILTFKYDFKKNFTLSLTFSITTIYIIFGFFYSQTSLYLIYKNNLLTFGFSLIISILLISLSQSLFIRFAGPENNSTVYLSNK